VKRFVSAFLLAGGLLVAGGVQAEYLYVSNASTNVIGQYQKDGTTVTYPLVNVPSTPASVAIDAMGNIYVSEYTQGNISKYSASGLVLNSSLISGLNGGIFITISSDGFLYVAEQGSGTVKKYNLDGTQVNTFSLMGLSYPSGIVTDASGNIYVADYGVSVGKYSAVTGAVISVPFISDGLLYTLATDSNANIYGGYAIQDGIKKYDSSGNLQATFTGNNNSYSLLADGDGNVYNGSAGSLQKYNSSGTQVSSSLVSPAGNIFGLAIGSPPPPASIPSLSEWTQLLLALMTIMLVGWHFHRERSY
jgi:streptogramin lyase